MYKKIVVFIIILIPVSCFGQNKYFAYKKYEHTWEDPNPVPAVIDQQYAHKNCVITKDDNLFSVGGSLGSITNILIERSYRIKYQNSEGISDKNVITIPESLDPLYDIHSWPFKINPVTKGPSYFELELRKFALRIIKPDGRIVAAEYDDNYIEERSIFPYFKYTLTYKYVNNHYWKFKIKNLEPGDEIECFYQIMIPYGDNYVYFNSGRIFHNSDVPKQNYSLVFRYKTGPKHNITFYNNGDPDSTAIIDKVKNYYWTRKNLDGCINEPGAIPHLSLPYMIYSINTEPKFYEYNDPVTTEIKFVPYWVWILRIKEHFDFVMRKNEENEIKDKQNLKVRSFINEQITGIPDSLKYYQISVIHNTIADSFAYLNDEALFNEEDIRSENIGDHTAEKKIREISRQKLYAKVLNNLKINYMTLYIMDKRYGAINEYYQSPIWNTECLYAAFFDGSTAFMHPKKSDFGWYMEEIPFYWENTSGLLINNDQLYYEYAEKPLIMKTAASSLNDNIRNSNILVNCNTNDNTVKFDSRVSLSGQFSTITRMIYTKNILDSVNNPLYRKHIYDIDEKVKLTNTSVTKQNQSFPYKTDINCSYESNSSIVKNNDDTYSLKLGGWFNHIIYDNLDTVSRSLDFYPDFANQDTYRYMIKFDKPVTIVSKPENIDVKNSLGNLVINISQPQPDALLIESQFIVVADLVRSKNYSDVLAHFNSIKKLNTAELVFTTAR